jgi:hypothetical protein
MNKPHVGQIAVYRDAADDSPRAAIVCQVWSEVLVNCCVFTSEGRPESKMHVNYWDGQSPKPDSRIVSEE